MTEVVLQATLTCPHCGHVRIETMPTDSCQRRYVCHGCGRVLRPRPGYCCVFCSYGSRSCPPIQEFFTAYREWTRRPVPRRSGAQLSVDPIRL